MQPPHPTFVNQNEEVQLLVEEMREGLGEMNNIKAEIANDKLEMKMQVLCDDYKSCVICEICIYSYLMDYSN